MMSQVCRVWVGVGFLPLARRRPVVGPALGLRRAWHPAPEAQLSFAQLKQYENRRYFDVIGGITGQRYRIRHGRLRNVDLVDKDDRPSSTLCFMPKGDLAIGDVMLAQKIALELYESQALMVANRTAVWGSISKVIRRDYRL